MDDVPGRFNPLAVVSEAGAEGDGADDGIGGDGDDHGLLDDRGKGEAEVRGALGEESRGMGVTVDRGVVGDSVFFGDGFGAAPMEKFAFDFGALAMAADATLAIVTPAPTGNIGPVGGPGAAFRGR
jgi:hypothetical protein